jgi:acyl-CoA thioesterase-1
MLALGAALAASCSPATQDQSARDAAADNPVVAASGGKHVVLAFLGDSLTAGLGLAPEQSFPSLIQGMFNSEGYDVDVINAGVSGDTTAGGARRVDQLLSANARIVVVSLGGNDALRGLTTKDTHDNLASIIDACLSRGAVVMLTGMEAPTNLGEDYQTAFRSTYIRLSAEYKGSIEYVPFLLDGVAGHPELNQADGIHPNLQGAQIVAQQLYSHLKLIVDRLIS